MYFGISDVSGCIEQPKATQNRNNYFEVYFYAAISLVSILFVFRFHNF